jgi:hypothetical protein
MRYGIRLYDFGVSAGDEYLRKSSRSACALYQCGIFILVLFASFKPHGSFCFVIGGGKPILQGPPEKARNSLEAAQSQAPQEAVKLISLQV